MSNYSSEKTGVFISTTGDQVPVMRELLKAISPYFEAYLYESKEHALKPDGKSLSDDLMRKIQNSDVLIGLYGSEYGYECDFKDKRDKKILRFVKIKESYVVKKSVTEWEYDTAKKLKKIHLMIYIDELKIKNLGIEENQKKFIAKVSDFEEGVKYVKLDSVNIKKFCKEVREQLIIWLSTTSHEKLKINQSLFGKLSRVGFTNASVTVLIAFLVTAYSLISRNKDLLNISLFLCLLSLGTLFVTYVIFLNQARSR